MSLRVNTISNKKIIEVVCVYVTAGQEYTACEAEEQDNKDYVNMLSEEELEEANKAVTCVSCRKALAYGCHEQRAELNRKSFQLMQMNTKFEQLPERKVV